MSLYYSSLEAKMARQREETMMLMENQKLQQEALTIANQRNKFASQAAEISLRNAKAISNVVGDVVSLAVAKSSPDFDIQQYDNTVPSAAKTTNYLNRIGLNPAFHSRAIADAADKMRVKTLFKNYATFYQGLANRGKSQGDFNKFLSQASKSFERRREPSRSDFKNEAAYAMAVRNAKKRNSELDAILALEAPTAPETQAILPFEGSEV